MKFLQSIIGLIFALLLSAVGAPATPMAPTAAHQAVFFSYQEAVRVEHTDMYFATRAPLVSAANVAITGDVTVMQGSAFALYGQETVAALFGFSADHIAPNRVTVSDIGELRPPALQLLDGEDVLIGPTEGLQSRTAGTFDDVVQGAPDDAATTYLYTIDDRGVNIALRSTTAATPRGNIVHSNLSERAVIGGEAWFGPNNTVTIDAGSGRFGDGAGITQQQWGNTVRYWEGLGYTVDPIPFGSRGR